MSDDRKLRELGEFLRVKRETLTPQDVGLPSRPRTRTSGLRREDVAQRAGVSLSWYTWLEQGRDIRPSPGVLANVTRALLLSEDEQRYAFDLAGQPRPAGVGAPRERVTPGLQRTLDLMDVPAYVLNERWDRIGWNDALLALMGDFASAPPIERNVVWRAFLDPATRSLTADWRETAHRLLAEFQAAAGRHLQEGWMQAFVDMMSDESPEFRQWWPRRTVSQRREKTNVVHHPEVGVLHFDHLSFYLADEPDLMLSIFTPLEIDDGPRRLSAAVAGFRAARQPGRRQTG